jgi:outer membrane lipoprotein-sorting protein
MLSATPMLILWSGLAFAHPGASGAEAALLDRMDRAALQFHGMTAQIKHTSHTEVIHEDSVAMGRVKMRKMRAGSVEGLIDFTTPDAKTYLFVKRTAKIYTPASRTVEVIDLGKHGEQLDQFLMIGFGTSRADLERGYTVKYEGQEKINGRLTEHLVLTPRAKEAAQYVTTVDLWIASDTGYPVREKVLQPSRDFVQVDYSNIVINPPLRDEDFTLKLPKDVQTIYPQK